MIQEQKLFPEYLNQGSEGPAVVVLQLMLKVIDLRGSSEIEIDGHYGSVTAAAVKELQRALNVEQDGNFGPQTREAFTEDYGIDVNALLAGIFEGKTTVAFPPTAV